MSLPVVDTQGVEDAHISDPALECTALVKSYGSKQVLTDFSLSVARGSIHGFVGRNGSGKTTTMQIIIGTAGADRGDVRIMGAPAAPINRRQVGYMPEERGLYPRMKVREQLVYFAQLHGLDRERAHASAEHWIERLGVADRAEERLEHLSLGNQQRVQLAVALIHEPTLLVLDEPFSGLDPTAVDVMCEVLMERAAASVAVLFSSHQLEIVQRICTMVTIIEDGHLLAEGTVEDLRRSAGRVVHAVLKPGAEQKTALAGLDGIAKVRKPIDPTSAAVDIELRPGVDILRFTSSLIATGLLVDFTVEEATLADAYRLRREGQR